MIPLGWGGGLISFLCASVKSSVPLWWNFGQAVFTTDTRSTHRDTEKNCHLPTSDDWLAHRKIASAETSMSFSVVDQFDTEIRIA